MHNFESSLESLRLIFPRRQPIVSLFGRDISSFEILRLKKD